MFEKGMFKLKQNITEQNSAKSEKEHKQIEEKMVFLLDQRFNGLMKDKSQVNTSYG